jgi:hypothetical protein
VPPLKTFGHFHNLAAKFSFERLFLLPFFPERIAVVGAARWVFHFPPPQPSPKIRAHGKLLVPRPMGASNGGTLLASIQVKAGFVPI